MCPKSVKAADALIPIPTQVKILSWIICSFGYDILSWQSLFLWGQKGCMIEGK